MEIESGILEGVEMNNRKSTKKSKSLSVQLVERCGYSTSIHLKKSVVLPPEETEVAVGSLGTP